MAGLLGTIENFDPQTEDWTRYVKRVKAFFKANDLTGEDKAEKRQATLLTLIGPTTYQRLTDLVAPADPDEKTFEQLVEVLTKHYSLKKGEIMQRYRFYTRSRQTGETVAEFVADLRRLAAHCKFGDTLEIMLRDRIVCGIYNSSIQKKLFCETDLTFERAFAIAEGSAEADKNVKELETLRTHPSRVTMKQEPVNKVQPRSEKQRPKRCPEIRSRESDSQDSDTREKPCYRCGGTNHKARNCKFREQYCRKCELKGYIARVCRGKPKRRSTKTVDEETVEESDGSLHAVRTTTGRVPPYKVQVLVDGCEVPMEIDTGASKSIISESMFRSIWPKRKLVASIM